jgi:hypothetical protein
MLSSGVCNRSEEDLYSKKQNLYLRVALQKTYTIAVNQQSLGTNKDLALNDKQYLR